MVAGIVSDDSPVPLNALPPIDVTLGGKSIAANADAS